MWGRRESCQVGTEARRRRARRRGQRRSTQSQRIASHSPHILPGPRQQVIYLHLCGGVMIMYCMDQITIKTPNPKSFHYWWLIGFTDWRYSSQSCWNLRRIPVCLFCSWLEGPLYCREHRISSYFFSFCQCYGPITSGYRYGSGSSDQYLWLTDQALDPALFVSDLQDANIKLIFFSTFVCSYFLKVHLHHSSRIKVIKKSQNSRSQGFSYNFCLRGTDLDPGGPIGHPDPEHLQVSLIFISWIWTFVAGKKTYPD
jgi:hypothetical protein